MSKQRIIFEGTENSGTYASQLEVYANKKNEVHISLFNWDILDIPLSICLDRNTAIKLVKQLKREIGKLEVQNG